MLQVREKGATSGAGVLATFAYDDLGRRASVTRGNGASTSYGWDAVSRLSQLSHDFNGTTHDLTLTYAYNPASQIVSTTRSNDLYSWTGHGSGTTASTADGLNRLASHGSATPAYDTRGNLTWDGTFAYTYSSENLLASTGNSGTLEYDPLMRFYRNYTTYFIHDGSQLIGEYYNGSIVNRYVPGAADDEPVAVVGKTGTRAGFHADERGSIIAASDDSGGNTYIVRYDENGKRAPGSYRYAYTGQIHLINDVYDYKSRNYNARLGRFLQTDRIGYGGGMNLYAYVGGDPVNFVDPLGLEWRRHCVDGGDGILKCGYHWVEEGRAALLGSGSSRDRRAGSQGPVSDGGGTGEGPCPPPGDSSFLTPEDAGLAAVQAQRQAQRAARNGRGDNLERSFSLTGSAAQGYGYSLRLAPGTERTVPIPITAVGGGHLHTIGGGNTLSRASDMSDRFNKGDVDDISRGLDQLSARGVDVSRVTTILGAENGTVFAWRGRNLARPGRKIGPDQCK